MNNVLPFQEGTLQEDTKHLFGFSPDCVYSKTLPIDFSLKLREVAKNVKTFSTTLRSFEELHETVDVFLKTPIG